MRNFLKRFNLDIYRDLQNVELAFKLHGTILLITILFFGLMGIVPLFTVLRTKFALSTEMQDKHQTMQNNLVKLEAAKKSLQTTGVNFDYLDEYMPEDTSMHKYILDFVAAVGARGYTVNRFNQTSAPLAVGSPEITVAIEGYAYPTELATVVENLKRVTQISSLSFRAGDIGEPNEIILVLLIYNYY